MRLSRCLSINHFCNSTNKVRIHDNRLAAKCLPFWTDFTIGGDKVVLSSPIKCTRSTIESFACPCSWPCSYHFIFLRRVSRAISFGLPVSPPPPSSSSSSKSDMRSSSSYSSSGLFSAAAAGLTVVFFVSAAASSGLTVVLVVDCSTCHNKWTNNLMRKLFAVYSKLIHEYTIHEYIYML